MKGLLLKDFYVTLKSCKMFFVIDAIFIAMSFVLFDSFNDSFIFLMYPVLMSGVLTINLLSFDEKSKWTKYSGSLPYSPAQIVSSKYIFGLIIQVFTTLIVFFALVIWVNTVGDVALSEAAVMLGRMFIISFTVPSVGLPFCFRFGTEKGRLFYFVSIFGMAMLLVNFADKLEAFFKIKYLFLIIIAAVVAIYAASLAISIAVYKNREVTG